MAMQNLMMRQMKLARPRNIMMSIRGGDKELTAKALDFCSKLAYELRLELDNETRLCNKNKQQRSWSWNAAQRPRSNKIEGSSQKQAGRVAVFSGTPGKRRRRKKKKKNRYIRLSVITISGGSAQIQRRGAISRSWGLEVAG